MSQRESATLFMTLLAGVAVLFQRYSGQDDVVLGSPIANRNRGETEDLRLVHAHWQQRTRAIRSSRASIFP